MSHPGWDATEKGFPIWGKLSAKRTDEGKAYVAVIKTGNKANFPLIRPLRRHLQSPR